MGFGDDLIELGAKLGIGFPGDGLLHSVDEQSARQVLDGLRSLEESYGARFKPSELLISMAEKGESFFESL